MDRRRKQNLRAGVTAAIVKEEDFSDSDDDEPRMISAFTVKDESPDEAEEMEEEEQEEDEESNEEDADAEFMEPVGRTASSGYRPPPPNISLLEYGRQIFKQYGLGETVRCNFCKKTVTTKRTNYGGIVRVGEMIAHAATHTSALLFDCRHCPYKAKGKMRMEQHLKRYHKLSAHYDLHYTDVSEQHRDELVIVLDRCYGTLELGQSESIAAFVSKSRPADLIDQQNNFVQARPAPLDRRRKVVAVRKTNKNHHAFKSSTKIDAESDRTSDRSSTPSVQEIDDAPLPVMSNASVVLNKSAEEASYSDLITLALCSSPAKKMTTAEIYDWISKNIPSFKLGKGNTRSSHWKNSIRHTLCTHSRFKRVPMMNQERPGTGKPGLWMLDVSDAERWKNFGLPKLKWNETKTYHDFMTAMKGQQQIKKIGQSPNYSRGGSDSRNLTERLRIGKAPTTRVLMPPPLRVMRGISTDVNRSVYDEAPSTSRISGMHFGNYLDDAGPSTSSQYYTENGGDDPIPLPIESVAYDDEDEEEEIEEVIVLAGK